jgi:hypothetical protein
MDVSRKMSESECVLSSRGIITRLVSQILGSAERGTPNPYLVSPLPILTVEIFCVLRGVAIASHTATLINARGFLAAFFSPHFTSDRESY